VEVHLQGVASDRPEQRFSHFQNAAQISYIALRKSAVVWGEQDPRRADLYYSLLKQLYLHSLAIEIGDETGVNLREYIPDEGWLRSRTTALKRVYCEGLNLHRGLDSLYQGNSDEAMQARAMVSLYEADWHLMFNQPRAAVAYQRAFNNLINTGIDGSQINQLLSRPSLLPLPQFYPELAKALAATIEDSSAAESVRLAAPADARDSIINYTEWVSDLPAISFPGVAPQLLSATTTDNQVWLNFQVDGVERVSRWINGRFRARRGVVRTFSTLGEASAPAILESRLHGIHIRPRVLDGVATITEGTLLYHYTEAAAIGSN
jgi:hypothetical protein